LGAIPPFHRAAFLEAYHQRLLFLYDEALGNLFREHPEVEQEIYASSARIFELLAQAARRHARDSR
jgi:hypothetical protein